MKTVRRFFGGHGLRSLRKGIWSIYRIRGRNGINGVQLGWSDPQPIGNGRRGAHTCGIALHSPLDVGEKMLGGGQRRQRPDGESAICQVILHGGLAGITIHTRELIEPPEQSLGGTAAAFMVLWPRRNQ